MLELDSALLEAVAKELVEENPNAQELAAAVTERYGWPAPWNVVKALAKAGHEFIGPQPGFQVKALECTADVAIFDGDAGSGKSFVLLMEVLHYIQDVPGYNAVIFRETRTDVTKPEGLWDKSQRLYAGRGKSRGSMQFLDWEFYPYSNRLQFNQLHTEDEKFSWQGAELCFIGFDELTHFSESQFVYLISRSRSMCGVRPYVRATCNPDRNSWVFKWVRPWVDKTHKFYGIKDGEHLYYRRVPLEEQHPDDMSLREWRRWLILREGEMGWVKKGCPMAKSLTAIYGPLDENLALKEADPDYAANLYSQDRVTRRRLTSRDWMVREDAMELFDRDWFKIIERHEVPAFQRKVRTWDLAATDEQAPGSGRGPDYTANAGVGSTFSGDIVIEDLEEFRGTYNKVVSTMAKRAKDDGPFTKIVIEQERIGSQGKLLIGSLKANELAGYTVIPVVPKTGKIERAKELSRWAEKGKVYIVRQPLLEQFLTMIENFPDIPYDDLVDAVCWAVLYLVQHPTIDEPANQGPSFGKPRRKSAFKKLRPGEKRKRGRRRRRQ